MSSSNPSVSRRLGHDQDEAAAGDVAHPGAARAPAAGDDVVASSMARAAARHRPRKPVLYAFGGITLLGVAVFGLSWQYPFMNAHQLGPGFVPRIASAGLMLMGVLLLMEEIRRGSVLVGDGASAEEAEQSHAELKATHRKLIFVGILTIVACLLFPVQGMLPSLTILAFVLSAFVEKMPKVISAIITAAAFGVLYLLFVTILGVDMPFGIFSAEFWGAP